MTDDPGFISLIPTLVVFILAVLTRRPIESLISGSLVGLIMLNGTQFVSGFMGSHVCFYSDATVLTAQATGCTPMQHALTQIPYALIAAAISLAGYLLLAFL